MSTLMVVALSDLTTTRLVSAAGLVILLYDHLLSFSDEVRFIWSAKLSSSKVLFLGMRYVVPPVMIGHTVQLSGLAGIYLSDTVCKTWYPLSIIIGWLTLAINDWLVLLRVWVVWDRNRIFILCTLSMFLVANIVVLVLSGIGFARIIPTIYFEEEFVDICMLDASHPIFRVLWLPGSVMVLSMVWKAITSRHTRESLIRDGYLYFLLLFVINLLNAILVLAARSSLMLVTVFLMWCLTTTTTCRMILSLRRSNSPDGQSVSDDQDEDTYEESQSATHLELAWIRGQSASIIRDPTPTPLSVF
ncbi:hypothetical protein MSAN_00193800 [Mycena sanguinolenta]|uniref:DUF6533 domain-containing protein n=1 Tax=Mycena sanguinolenta TaxID=230812 RepID=A0A8H6ZEV4_9AGAR|nr:hypothetical protein MSAN_00193800 [Mycena sanguinolenta]